MGESVHNLHSVQATCICLCDACLSWMTYIIWLFFTALNYFGLFEARPSFRKWSAVLLANAKSQYKMPVNRLPTALSSYLFRSFCRFFLPNISHNSLWLCSVRTIFIKIITKITILHKTHDKMWSINTTLERFLCKKQPCLAGCCSLHSHIHTYSPNCANAKKRKKRFSFSKSPREREQLYVVWAQVCIQIFFLFAYGRFTLCF